jgi:hypothetical protein
LSHLEVLRAYKAHFGRDERKNLSPFALDQVVGYATDIGTRDVPEIHAAVRQRIREAVESVRGGHGSQILILAGNPGMGKSHLVNWFRSRERGEELGYVLVGNSNHWRSGEFEACLLDWMLEALTGPQEDLLLEKVQDVAFQALAQILDKPGEITRYRKGVTSGVLGRLWGKLLGKTHQRFRRRLLRRDVRVFRRLHFGRFARYVCSRFLHQSSHPFHRYVMHVLLRYLFEEDRELVRAWLRRRPVGEQFLRRLAIHDEIDQNYKLVETIKVLISLFGAEVSRGLSQGRGHVSPARVFFFAFDQAEGRDALFEGADSEREWLKFFAQLSELYNALPNVFVLFTMTVSLSQKLYPRMEGQFQDRIRKDHRFVLHEVEDREVLALYRRHVEAWLGDGQEGVRAKLEELNNPYLPFDQKQVLDLAHPPGTSRTLRDMLKVFDARFRAVMDEIVTAGDPLFDYRVAQKEIRHEEEEGTSDYAYTKDHLKATMDLFGLYGLTLVRPLGFDFSQVRTPDGSGAPQLLELYFHAVGNPSCWVRVFLCRISRNYRRPTTAGIELLKNRPKNKNLLYLIRNDDFSPDIPEGRREQVSKGLCPPAVHTDLRAFLRVLTRKDAYDPAAWEKAEPFFQQELRKTYLGDLLKQVRRALERQQGKAGEPEPDVAAEPTDVDEAAAHVLLQSDLPFLEAMSDSE